MRVLRAYIRFANRLNEAVGFGVSWLTTLLVLVVCYDVFTRYLLKMSIVAVQELQWHLFAVIFLVGAAYTLKHGGHVRVDVFYSRFSEKAKAWIDLVGSLVFLIPFSILAIWSSQGFVAQSFALGETSPNPGGLPYRFVLKLVIPVGFLLLALQGIALAFRSLLKILGEATEDESEQHEAEL